MPQFNTSSVPNMSLSGTAGGANHDTLKVYTNVFALSGSAAAGYSLDISSAGFTAITSVQMNPINNTTSVVAVPIISEKSRSTTAIVVNILTIQSTQVTALLQTVTGAAFATNLAGMSIDLRVEGY